MGYKAAIFDMDGTILDTLEDLHDALNRTLRLYGYPERTLDETRSFVGNGIRKLIERALPDKDATEERIEELFAGFMPYYEKHCADRTRPYDGICELIQRLKNAGIYTAVVSNKADPAVQELCKTYFKGCFDVAIGEQAGIAKKPAADMVDLALERIGTAREDTVYIGDSDVDIMTAANSSMDCIAVKWGFRDEAFLKEYGAKIFADKPEDLYELITG